MGAFELLNRAIESGLRVVQFGPNLPLDALAPSELDRLARQASEWGIRIEIGTRGVQKENLLAQLELAQHIGAKLIRCTAEVRFGVPLSTPDLVKALQAALPALTGANVRLAIENTLLPAKEMALAIETLASPLVGITLDTVNSLAIPEGTEEVVEALSPYVHCLHVKDFAVKRQWHSMGFVVEGRPAGQGQLNIPSLLKTIHQAGSSPSSAILELWPPPQESIAATVALENLWSDESIRFLRSHIEH